MCECRVHLKANIIKENRKLQHESSLVCINEGKLNEDEDEREIEGERGKAGGGQRRRDERAREEEERKGEMEEK